MRIGVPIDNAQTIDNISDLFDERSPSPSMYLTPEPDSAQNSDMPPSSDLDMSPSSCPTLEPDSAVDPDMSSSSPQSTPRASPTPTLGVDGQPKDRTFKLRPQIHLHHTQVQTPAKRRAGSEGATKRRYHEVDYSQSLRETLHEKDLQVNNLQQKLQEQEQALKEQYEVLHDRVLSAARQEFEKQNSDVLTTLNQREDEYARVLGTTRQELKHQSADLRTLLQDRQDEVTALHNSLKAQVQQHHAFVTQMHRDRELSNQRHEEELREIKTQLEKNMGAQMDNFLEVSSFKLTNALQQRDHEIEAKTVEMEQRLQAELDRRAKQMTADKERELANMEQRYARHSRTPLAQSLSNPDVVVQVPDLPMDTEVPSLPQNESARAPTQSLPSTTSTRNQAPPKVFTPTPVTPSLDAIRRIRKSHAGAVSRRTCLIGVSVEEERAAPREVPVCTEEEEQEQPNIQTMADAIAKAVEVALRNTLWNKDMPHPAKRSPRRRRVEDQQVTLEKETEPSQHRDFILGEVRRLFKDVFKISQDTDFVAHIPALADDVYAYEHEDGAGPDPDDLTFDLAHNSTSLWNSAILEILLHMFQKRSSEQKWPVTKPDNYIRVELRNRYKKLRTAWLRGQPKLAQNGVVETPVEVEERLLEQMNRLGKQSRQATRRRNKYHRRITVLGHIVKLKAEVSDDDLDSWKWLRDLITLLGEHGMSSEESAVENDVQHVFRVKQMGWRRNIDRELDVIDTERLIGNDIFSPQGARPVKRIRASENPATSRKAVEGLPIDLYDGAWLTELTQREFDTLGIPKDRFLWRRIAVA